MPKSVWFEISSRRFRDEHVHERFWVVKKRFLKICVVRVYK